MHPFLLLAMAATLGGAEPLPSPRREPIHPPEPERVRPPPPPPPTEAEVAAMAVERAAFRERQRLADIEASKPKAMPRAPDALVPAKTLRRRERMRARATK